MQCDFDVFIIGGGPAGQTLARACADGGLRVGITEYRGYGGTCTLRGCDPKRVLVTSTKQLQATDNLQGHGLVGMPTFDWQQSRDAVAAIINPIPRKSEDALREAGIQVFDAQARFVGERTLDVDGRHISAPNIVIATGQKPAPLDMAGAAFAKTSDDFHQLEDLPERILFIGGGYIGMESAHFCARAGRQVIVLNDDDDPLQIFDPELVERFLDVSRKLGITLYFDTEATEIAKLSGGNGFGVSTKNKDGHTERYDVDLVMNSAGRIPNLDTLDLERAGITAQANGIAVDDYFRVLGSPGIYAIGDVALSGAPPLTPVANTEARALAKTLLGTETRADYRGIATVIYGVPELASVGLTERKALDEGLNVEVRALINADDKFNAKRTGAQAYGFKVLVDKNERLLGAHILGPQAGEQINLLALALRYGITLDQLREMPFAYPTWGSDISAMVSSVNARQSVCSEAEFVDSAPPNQRIL